MSKGKLSIIKLCIVAVMSALFVVLDLVSIKIGDNIKITFSGLPIILTAIYLGPVSGMITGLIGAFIGQILSYGLTVTTVLWILPAGIRGLSMGLLFMAFKRSYKIKFIAIEVIISSLLVTAANTAVMYIDSKIFGYYSFAYVFGASAFRFVSSIATAIVFILILTPVIIALNKQNLIHQSNKLSQKK